MAAADEKSSATANNKASALLHSEMAQVYCGNGASTQIQNSPPPSASSPSVDPPMALDPRSLTYFHQRLSWVNQSGTKSCPGLGGYHPGTSGGYDMTHQSRSIELQLNCIWHN
eukprot:796139_1